MASTRAFLAGIGVAYLFDPRQGRRRRRMLGDRLAKLGRRALRLFRRRARFAFGHGRGLVARARGLVIAPSRRIDDVTVAQRIRSDAFRDVGVSSQDVDVHVDGGVVTLRGAVEGRTLADELVARIYRVPGVRDVAAMIRVTSAEAEEEAHV